MFLHLVLSIKINAEVSMVTEAILALVWSLGQGAILIYYSQYPSYSDIVDHLNSLFTYPAQKVRCHAG